MLLIVLRQHQNPYLRALLTKLERGAHAVGCSIGRHLHIDDCHVGAVVERTPQEVVRIPGLGQYLETLFHEQSCDALTKEDVVLTDHDPYGRGHSRATVPGAASQVLLAHAVRSVEAQSVISDASQGPRSAATALTVVATIPVPKT